MTDVHEARVEAAAEATWAIDDYTPWSEVDEVQREIFREDARIALAAADAVVTVEMIVDEIAGHPIGSGYYRSSVSVDEAREIAEAVHALLTGEEHHDD